MQGTGFWWILLAMALYGVIHSILAANGVKRLAARWVGDDAYRKYYRLFYSVMGGITLLPVLVLMILLPDRVIYSIPFPLVMLTLLVQALCLIGLLMAVSSTGGVSVFIGLYQAMRPGGIPMREKFVADGLYRLTRHPIYTCSILFVWLMPVMGWNLLALNIGLTAYMIIGSIFEERKLVEQFGQTYIDYRKKTPRIIPGIKLT